METAIQVVWGLGLVVALLMTAVVLKEVSLVLGALRDIHHLVRRTQTAATGLAANVRSDERLEALAEPAGRLRQAVQAIATACRSIRQRLEGGGT